MGVRMRITVNTPASRLSQYAGIGSRRESRAPSPWPAPSRLPTGHQNLGLCDRWFLLGTDDMVGAEPAFTAQGRRFGLTGELTT